MAKVYKQILPIDVVNSIIEFYNSEPAQCTESGIVNKNLEYHIPENFIYVTLKPYMDIVVGADHEFSTGSYKSSDAPYIIHVDSRIQHDQYTCMSFDSGIVKHNTAVLIPLVQGSEFRTVAFNQWSDFNPTVEQMKTAKSSKNHLLKEDFDHDKTFEYFNYLDIDVDYHWCLGDILTWDRNQWHISNNFAKFNKIKTFLVLFMA